MGLIRESPSPAPNCIFSRETRPRRHLGLGYAGAAICALLVCAVSRRRLDFSKFELANLAEVAANSGVPITLQRIAPDGTKTIVTAGKNIGGNGAANDNPWDSVLDADQERAS